MLTSAVQDPAIAAVFDKHPSELCKRLLELRRLILATAAATPGVGRLTETLKWGQISYLTLETKSGTTIRIDVEGDGLAMFVNCQTDLVDRYRAAYPDKFRYSGTRALLLANNTPVDTEALGHCIAMALTYHLSKRRKMQRPPGGGLQSL